MGGSTSEFAASAAAEPLAAWHGADGSYPVVPAKIADANGPLPYAWQPDGVYRP